MWLIEESTIIMWMTVMCNNLPYSLTTSPLLSLKCCGGVFTPTLFSQVESKSGALHLSWCEPSDHTRLWTKTTGLRPCWGGGLSLSVCKPTLEQFVCSVNVSGDLTRLQEALRILDRSSSCITWHARWFVTQNRLRRCHWTLFGKVQALSKNTWRVIGWTICLLLSIMC